MARIVNFIICILQLKVKVKKTLNDKTFGMVILNAMCRNSSVGIKQY